MIHSPVLLWPGDPEFTKSYSSLTGWSKRSEICFHEGNYEQGNSQGQVSMEGGLLKEGWGELKLW